MPPITEDQLNNASLDAAALEAVVNGPAVPGTVETRLGQELRTLARLEADALPAAADLAAHEARLDTLETDVDAIEAAIGAAPGAVDAYYATEAAGRADGGLANNSYFRVYPSTHGGAYDVYQKISAGVANYQYTFYSKANIDTLLATQLATLLRLNWAEKYEKPSLNRPTRVLCTEDGRLLISVRPQDAVYRDGYARHPGDLGHFEFINFNGRGTAAYTLPHLWDICSLWSEFDSKRVDQGNFSWNKIVDSATFDNGEGHSTSSPAFFVDKMSNSTGGAPNGNAEFTASITGATMTVTAVTSGTIKVGAKITGAGLADDRFVTALGTGVGGVGTYTVSGAGDRAVQTMYSWGWNQTASGVGHGLIDVTSFAMFIYGDGGSYPATVNGVAVADGTNIRDTIRPGDVIFCKKFVFDFTWHYKTPDGTLAIVAGDGYTIDPNGVGQFQSSTNNVFQANMGVNAGYAILLSLRDPNRVAVRRQDNSTAVIATGADPASAAVDALGKAQNCTFYNTDSLGHCVDVIVPNSYAPFRRANAPVAWGADLEPFISRRAAGPKLSYPSHANSATVDNEGGNTISTYHIINFSRANSAPALV